MPRPRTTRPEHDPAGITLGLVSISVVLLLAAYAFQDHPVWSLLLAILAAGFGTTALVNAVLVTLND